MLNNKFNSKDFFLDTEIQKCRDKIDEIAERHTTYNTQRIPVLNKVPILNTAPIPGLYPIAVVLFWVAVFKLVVL